MKGIRNMNEIVKAGSTNIIRTMDDAERAARAMSASGFFSDSKNAAQAVVKILAGSELGFGPFASMNGVSIIQGKPALGANLMAAAVKRTGKYNYRVTKNTDKEVEIAFFEGGQEVGKSSFTWADAEKAQLTNKDNWRKYPRNMLFARAISNGIRWFTPDIYNGATVYTPDELGAVTDEEGNVVEGKVEPVTTTPALVDPEAIYQESAARVMKIVVQGKNKEVAIGDMSKEQLEWVIKHAQIQANADAAVIVLQHDYAMEPESPSGMDASTEPTGQMF
jgi:hypothetical protein